MFRAYDPERERLVAIKVFRLDLPPERVHRLVAELEAIIDARLEHPALAASLTAGIVEANAFLAQEFLVAESLDTVLRDRGTLKLDELLRLTTQLAAALDAAADAQIEHGGLHPRDILLAGDEVKLTGLGVVRALERVGVSAPLRRPYTSPERMSNGTWDRRADVFSLAVVVSELLWGRRIAGTGSAAIDALGELPGMDATPLAPVKTVLARALDADPRARFDRATGFLDALLGALKGDVDVTAPTVVAQDSPEPPVRRHARRPTPRVIASTERRPLPKAEVEPQLPLAEVASPSIDEMPLRRDEQPVEAAPAPPPTLAPAFTLLPQQSNWPLAASLAVGLAVGFASGYGVGMHGPSTASVQSAPVATDPIVADIVAPPTARALPAEPPPSVRPTTPPAESRSDKPFLETPFEAASSAPAPRAPAAAAPNAAAKPSTSAAVGILQVRSNPSGANVVVDGAEHGRTPITVRALANGPHRVRISRDGYVMEDRRVTITAGKPASTLDVRLVRERPATPPRGRTAARVAEPKSRAAAPAGAVSTAASASGAALTIQSRPAGASVYVDGRLVGTTPLMVPSVAIGEHAVRIESPGYRTWSSSVDVKAGADNKVTLSLDR